ncbi:MAG: cyclic nucleotide-binding domain-containing protein [Symploca sp. SIO2B6]|nr:cyclic nucleotide-binding domain-containing protein [Symploca sp. SIO2B6]
MVYPTLLTDYFTTLEYKKYSPFVAIAQAAGMLLGGMVTALLSPWVSACDQLLCLPVVCILVIVQLAYLERSQRPIVQVDAQEKVGFIESITSFPGLAKRYPLGLLLAISSFLLVIISISSEFLWFYIYAQNFSEEALTGFLGMMRIVTSVVQIGVIYGLTRPLLQHIGVAKMNPVFAVTTLASLVGLAFNVNVPAAIALHINGDALYKAINTPIHQLNYNGIPREFIGRIRSLSDGVIFAFGFSVAGVVLWLGHHWLSLAQITWLAAGLTLILLWVRWPMGKLYGQGLEEMIRTNAINLDDLDNSLVPLPTQSSSAIQELLTSDTPYFQVQGLRLAANFAKPSEFHTDIQRLIHNDDVAIHHAAIHLFTQTTDQDLLQLCQQWLTSSSLSLQIFALKVLVANHHEFSIPEIEEFLEAEQLVIQWVGSLAALQLSSIPVPLQARLDTLWQTPVPDEVAIALAHVVIQSQNRDFIPLVQTILPHASAPTIQILLEALVPLTTSNDDTIADLALTQLHHSSAMVRQDVFRLLGVARCPHLPPYIAKGLEDDDPRVRQQAARSLANYGKAGVALAKGYLASGNEEQVRSAIAAIGQVRTKYANDVLFNYLAPERQQLVRTRKWQQQIPAHDPSWYPLAIAISDYHQRVIQQVLYILSCMGYSRTVNTVRGILATTNHQDTDNAVEVLASLDHRRFVTPILPLLEQRLTVPSPSDSELKVVSSAAPTVSGQPHPWFRKTGYKILLEAIHVSDRWIKMGAMIALAQVPSTLVRDPDPLVHLVASQIFPTAAYAHSFNHPAPFSTTMNRILLLKNVAIFKNLSLDELRLIDEAIEQEQVLANQTIYAEGNWGSHLYIIADGHVQLMKTIDDQPHPIRTLAPEQYFGEIALFDDAPRWDSAIALEDCTLLKLQKNRFISLISQRPHIILEICRFLSQRLRETDTYRLGQAPMLLGEGLNGGGLNGEEFNSEKLSGEGFNSEMSNDEMIQRRSI